MNKLKEFGIEENTYKECLKQALRAGEPTYKFLLGEKVCMGCTAHKTICAILDNGLCYLVDDGDKFMCKPWHELRPFSEGNSSFTKLSYGKLCCSNVSVEALLMKHLQEGIDLYPPYKRDYVWNEKDRERLLDSIFTGINIGRITLRRRSDYEWSEDNLTYEVIDGKQRLRTLLAYYENRFRYRGFYYNELSNEDRNQFLNADAELAVVDNLDMEGAIHIFLMTNKSGKAVGDIAIKSAENTLDFLEREKAARAKEKATLDNALKQAYDMIDRDAVKADCVTREEIMEELKDRNMEEWVEWLGDSIDELQEEDVENGFYIMQAESADAPHLALEIRRIDVIADLGICGIPVTNEEAGERAQRVGVRLINDLPGVEPYRFVDTPENRKLVREFYQK